MRARIVEVGELYSRIAFYGTAVCLAARKNNTNDCILSLHRDAGSCRKQWLNVASFAQQLMVKRHADCTDLAFGQHL